MRRLKSRDFLRAAFLLWITPFWAALSRAFAADAAASVASSSLRSEISLSVFLI